MARFADQFALEVTVADEEALAGSVGGSMGASRCDLGRLEAGATAAPALCMIESPQSPQPFSVFGLATIFLETGSSGVRGIVRAIRRFSSEGPHAGQDVC